MVSFWDLLSYNPASHNFLCPAFSPEFLGCPPCTRSPLCLCVVGWLKPRPCWPHACRSVGKAPGLWSPRTLAVLHSPGVWSPVHSCSGAALPCWAPLPAGERIQGAWFRGPGVQPACLHKFTTFFLFLCLLVYLWDISSVLSSNSSIHFLKFLDFFFFI